LQSASPRPQSGPLPHAIQAGRVHRTTASSHGKTGGDNLNQMQNSCRIAALLTAAVLVLWPAGRLRAAEFTLDNDLVTVTCLTKGGRLLPGSLRDKKTG